MPNLFAGVEEITCEGVVKNSDAIAKLAPGGQQTRYLLLTGMLITLAWEEEGRLLIQFQFCIFP